MFDYFKGIIADKRKTSKGLYITVDVSGIGYLLEVTESDYLNFNITTDEVKKVYSYMTHREDAMSLYGFSNKETRDIFQILLSVSGVGAKMALALLNEFDACNLISLVIDGDYKELTRAKGVGPKLAQKIILELKDKLIKTDLPKQSCAVKISNPAIEDTKAVLISLGYEDREIEDVLAKISVEENANSEEVIRKALTYLSM